MLLSFYGALRFDGWAQSMLCRTGYEIMTKQRLAFMHVLTLQADICLEKL